MKTRRQPPRPAAGLLAALAAAACGCDQGAELETRAEAEAITVQSFEGETMTVASGAYVYTYWSPDASGQRYRHLETFATVARDFTTASAADRIVVRAAAGVCDGGSEMVVRLDGVEVLRRTVTSSSFQDFAIARAVAAGAHRLTVQFTNDLYRSSTCNRWVGIDRVVFQSVAADAGTSTPPADGGAGTSSGGASFEGESMALPADKGRVFSDGAASGGSYLMIWSNGRASRQVTTAGSTSRLVVRVSGHQCAGAPQMVVSVDGARVLATAVLATAWTDHGVDVPLAAGTHTVAIDFTNDYTAPGCDRNLNVDTVSLAGGDTTTPPADAGTSTPPPPPDAGLPAPGNSLTLVPGREFAADSFVHRRLAPDAPLDPMSATWVADLRAQIREFYGVASVNIHQYSPPVYVVGPDQPTVRVRAWDRTNPSWSFAPLQEAWAEVPLPDNFQASPGTDQEAVVYQPSTGRYWEFWLMERTGARITDSRGRQVDEWGARWGGRLDNLGRNGGYWPTVGGTWDGTGGIKFGTTAAGISLLGTLMTIEEQQRGVINHAIAVALPRCMHASRWSFPAQRSDGRGAETGHVPQGAILRLPADLNLDAMDMDPYARMIARAVQNYGMIVRDTAGAVVLYAENPANRYAVDPYNGPGGILRCPDGVSRPECWATSNGRLRGFPWDRLQVLRTQMNR